MGGDHALNKRRFGLDQRLLNPAAIRLGAVEKDAGPPSQGALARTSSRHFSRERWGCQTPGSQTVQAPDWYFHHDSYQLSGCRTNVNTYG